METQVTLTIWTGVAYGAIKRVVVPYEYGADMKLAMERYASEHGFTLALSGEEGRAGLYWNDEGQLVRLAIEAAA
ncbi:hypothetical protein GCM10027592_04450 [Spirosoma flavus]